jgi:K+-transporting ATPase ATPase C chain
MMTLLLIVLTGLLYPGLITALGQLLFPHRANGSLVRVNGQVVGSELIGQAFTQPYYFHPRPSAAGNGYDATASAGTNKGPTDRKLADTLIAGSVAEVRAQTGATGALPADMVTRSGSGLDPHISPANAALQIGRVAQARGAAVDAVQNLVTRHTEGRTLGLLGEPRINVLLLNLALDREFPSPAPIPSTTPNR